jgi:hypothetical protein
MKTKQARESIMNKGTLINLNVYYQYYEHTANRMDEENIYEQLA